MIVRLAILAALVLASSLATNRSISTGSPRAREKGWVVLPRSGPRRRIFAKVSKTITPPFLPPDFVSPLTSPEAGPVVREQLQTRNKKDRVRSSKELKKRKENKKTKEMPVHGERSCTATTEYRAWTKIVPNDCGPYSSSRETLDARGLWFWHSEARGRLGQETAKPTGLVHQGREGVPDMPFR